MELIDNCSDLKQVGRKEHFTYGGKLKLCKGMSLMWIRSLLMSWILELHDTLPPVKQAPALEKLQAWKQVLMSVTQSQQENWVLWGSHKNRESEKPN